MNEERVKALSSQLGMALTQVLHGDGGWQIQTLNNGSICYFHHLSEVARLLDGILMEVALMQSFYDELLEKSLTWSREDTLAVSDWLADKGGPYATVLRELQHIQRPLTRQWRRRAISIYAEQLKSGISARHITRAKTVAILQSRSL